MLLVALLPLARWGDSDDELPQFVTDRRCPVCCHAISEHYVKTRLSGVPRMRCRGLRVRHADHPAACTPRGVLDGQAVACRASSAALLTGQRRPPQAIRADGQR